MNLQISVTSNSPTSYDVRGTLDNRKFVFLNCDSAAHVLVKIKGVLENPNQITSTVSEAPTETTGLPVPSGDGSPVKTAEERVAEQQEKKD